MENTKQFVPCAQESPLKTGKDDGGACVTYARSADTFESSDWIGVIEACVASTESNDTHNSAHHRHVLRYAMFPRRTWYKLEPSIGQTC